jgi:endonuclease/exonuclease/phosphatase family metal-dependent hydrolase
MKLKFITLNLWFGGILFDPILEFLKKENPDILVCQEVYAGTYADLDRQLRSFEILKKELNFPYANFAPAFLENKKEGAIDNGNAIFSRFLILDTKIIFYDVPYDKNYIKPVDRTKIIFTPRNLQEAVIELGKIKLNIFNTQGIWGFDGKDNERRLKMADTIINEAKDKENVILAGDFNVNKGTKTIANIEQYLKNVFDDELITTFNMGRKDNPGYATAVVDMTFVSKNIKVLEHYCPKIDISDHLPLISVLEI